MLKSLLNKVAGLMACNFVKKSLQHRCFPVKFVKFLRTPFLYGTFGGCFWWVYLSNDQILILHCFISNYLFVLSVIFECWTGKLSVWFAIAYWSSHLEVFCEKAVLKREFLACNFSKLKRDIFAEQVFYRTLWTSTVFSLINAHSLLNAPLQ